MIAITIVDLTNLSTLHDANGSIQYGMHTTLCMLYVCCILCYMVGHIGIFMIFVYIYTLYHIYVYIIIMLKTLCHYMYVWLGIQVNSYACYYTLCNDHVSALNIHDDISQIYYQVAIVNCTCLVYVLLECLRCLACCRLRIIKILPLQNFIKHDTGNVHIP